MRKYLVKIISVSLFLIQSSYAYAGSHDNGHAIWTINDLLSDVERPFVIGHRGTGDNLGENTDKPIENTFIDAVKRAFEAGVPLVEIDVTMTADGKAVLLHDDFLNDYTCVNTLTYDELKLRLPHVPKLSHVLHVAKKFARSSDHVSGLVNIEVKTPAPFCDVNDATEAALVVAVANAVETTGMQEQVVIESFSPAILSLFATEAGQLKRNLTISIIQLLSPEQVEAATGLSVTLIDKSAGFGLQWAETGPLYRLPGYRSADEYFTTAYLLGAQFLTVDKLILYQAEQTQPGSGAYLMQQLHASGFVVMPYTVDSVPEWQLLKSMGVDGIITNDIEMGLSQ